MVSKKNKSLKNNIDSHIFHTPIDSSSINKHVSCSTSSSNIKNDICMLKKSVDYLGSTLSQCAMNHTRLESMFRKKHAPHMQHTIHDIQMLIMLTHMIPCMLMCTLVQIMDVRATLQSFVMIEYIM